MPLTRSDSTHLWCLSARGLCGHASESGEIRKLNLKDMIRRTDGHRSTSELVYFGFKGYLFTDALITLNSKNGGVFEKVACRNLQKEFLLFIHHHRVKVNNGRGTP